MYLNVDPLEGEDVDLTESASVVQKAPSEESRKTEFKRIEEDRKPVTDEEA